MSASLRRSLSDSAAPTAFACDRFASASTGWATSIEESDVTSLLPAPPGYEYPVSHTALRPLLPSRAIADPGVHRSQSENLNSSPLSIHNPHFFTSHPPHLVQSLQLYLKSTVLMGRVVSWLQRALLRLACANIELC